MTMGRRYWIDDHTGTVDVKIFDVPTCDGLTLSLETLVSNGAKVYVAELREAALKVGE